MGKKLLCLSMVSAVTFSADCLSLAFWHISVGSIQDGDALEITCKKKMDRTKSISCFSFASLQESSGGPGYVIPMNYKCHLGVRQWVKINVYKKLTFHNLTTFWGHLKMTGASCFKVVLFAEPGGLLFLLSSRYENPEQKPLLTILGANSYF